MCAPSAPPAPDYKAAAQQTAAGNQNAAIAAQYGNMTNQAGPEQYAYDADTGQYTPTGTSTGVTYKNPAVPDSQGSMPFDMTSLTQAQKDAYYAGKGLPKDFVKAYTPQQWTQQQTLGANDQQLFNQSQATQLGLSNMALTGLDKVKQAIAQGVAPEIAIQQAPESTAGAMTTNIGTGGGLNAGRATGFADQDQVQRFVAGAGDITGKVADSGSIGRNIANAGAINTNIANAGNIRSDVADAGKIASTIGPIRDISFDTGANGVAQTTLDNNGKLIRLDSGANERASGLSANQQTAGQIKTNLGIDPELLNQQTQDALYKANTQYLDPQFGQSQAKLENQLANQGITRGSEAYNNAMLNFNNQKQQAYESARNQAIAGSTAAAQGMFGMGLQGAQFGNQALGQQFGQYTTAQQLANQAAGQNNANAQTNMGLTNAALGQQFGQGLQTAQFGNQAIAQNNANALSNAQFANAAQQQQFGQQMGLAGLTNAAQAQQYGQNANNTAVANAAQAQQFGQNTEATKLGLTGQQQQFTQNAADLAAANAAQSQLYGQNLSNTNLANTAQNQQYNQNLSNAQFTNAAGQQYFNNNLSAAQLQNAATAQNFGMDLTNQQQQLAANQANAALNNQALESQYNQALQSTQLNNQASNQQLAQNQAIQQNPLNILQALRTGAQLNTANLPAVGVSQPGQLANWSGPDMLGAATAQGQYNQGIYNAQTAANSALTSSLIGAGGALGSAGIKASDRRLKNNIKRIGTHILGIGLYTWDYLWGEPFAGVMAHEVEQVMPEAIVIHPSGFKMVNYEMLGLM